MKFLWSIVEFLNERTVCPFYKWRKIHADVAEPNLSFGAIGGDNIMCYLWISIGLKVNLVQCHGGQKKELND